MLIRLSLCLSVTTILFLNCGTWKDESLGINKDYRHTNVQTQKYILDSGVEGLITLLKISLYNM